MEINNIIENKIKTLALRDVEIKLLDAQIKGIIIPEVVFEILKELEKEYPHKSTD